MKLLLNFIVNGKKCECKSGYSFQSGFCVNSCQKDFISGLQTVDYQGLCIPCQIYNCLQCQQNTPFICKECQNNFYNLNQQACISQCPENYILLNKNQCIQICPQDTFRLQNDCFKQCPNGFYENYQNNKCDICSEDCHTCQNTKYQCTSCNNGLFLFFNECTRNCPEYHFYPDTLTQQCKECDSNCLQCKDSNYCYQCAEGTYMTVQHICQEQCPMFTIANPQKMTCDKCAQNCYTCELNINTCTSCWGQDLLNKENGVCVYQCPENQVANQEIRQCVSQQCEQWGCVQCDTISGQCFECKNSILKNGKCVMECLKEIDIIINNVCCPNKNNLVYGGQCIDSCPYETYEDSINQTCLYCIIGCLECTNNQVCDLCKPGYKQIDGNCQRNNTDQIN